LKYRQLVEKGRGLKIGNGRKLRLGIAGLGRAFTLMLPTLSRDPRIIVAGAADPREDARRRFAADFATPAYASVGELCADHSLEVVYVATPHQHHAEHAVLAAQHGKHVLVEKPMALTLSDCDAMIAAARKANVQLVVGPSHSFDLPIRRARELIAGGTFGDIRMISALNYTDYLYRPRLPEELDTSLGGGAVYNQAAHQVDIVRLLGGGRVRSVRGITGGWDRSRPTESIYSALLAFEGGTFASLIYGGHGNFDSDELVGWISESGQQKSPDRAAPRRFANAAEEALFKSARSYGGAAFQMPLEQQRLHEHFGFIIASCERADLRPLPDGVMIYERGTSRLDPLPPPSVPRAEVIDELYDAVVNGRAPLHDGAWAMATLEVCLAILQSARSSTDVTLSRQIGVP
jgi:phthalate 4,5-cis-dihydrodiol dehydrogenase